jgi:putative peptide zinc metalloprotease protein
MNGAAPAAPLPAASPPALAPLREELDLLPGPPLADGQPTHTLHDPVRNRFHQIDWTSFEILSRWHLGDPARIAAAVNAQTTLHLDADDVARVWTFCNENQLLTVPPGQAGRYAQRLIEVRGPLWKKALHGYLFFRVPLFKPDRWLTRWAPRLGWLYARPFWLATLAALIVGLFQIGRQWDVFTATLVDHFTLAGLASWGAALVVVKVLHEFGHAVTAKRLGCRVPTMGVAFLVLWPMAYTDTNEVWRLNSRRQRLMVGAAGVATELTVAVWAALAWALLPAGALRDAAFVLATTTWVLSITLNASPFMRFDGYFLLSDWLEMPNLHARAFALARWRLREWLFDLKEEPPEAFSRRRRAGLILFAWATWAYRLVVFLGIAVLVYAFFIKAVGIVLFIVEMVYFVLAPPLAELREWARRWPALRRSARARWSAALGLALGALLLAPWPNRIHASGLLRPDEVFIVYAPARTQLASLPVADGAAVRAGDLLATLRAPDLKSRAAAAVSRRDQLQWRATAGAFDREQLAQWPVSRQRLGAAESELDDLAAAQARNEPRAPFDGIVRVIDPELRAGDWLSEREPLLALAAQRSWQVVTYLDEQTLRLIRPGSAARFYADALSGPVLTLAVARIDPDAAHTLADGELAHSAGGSVVVREKKGLLYPEHAVYRVTLEVRGDPGALRRHIRRGVVVIDGDWSPPALRFAHNAFGVFWREAGF